ncbi:MAG: serine/threonine-protein kinase [Polyangiaceae bacterium]
MSDSSPNSVSESLPAATEGKPPRKVGRYRVMFPVASGGMGTVYAARLESGQGVERSVAVKVLHSRAANREELEAFFNEARITARLAHPNVVGTLELGEFEGRPFIVMDLVKGVSLRDLLRKLSNEGEKLSPGVVAWIIARAAAGLHAAHELTDTSGTPLQLVHRDISPDNIMLGYDGSVRLTDFGIAKLSTSEQTREGVLKGKFSYMSPEQVAAESLDRRSDIFSLGVVMWEAIACRRLFRAGSPRDTVAKILAGRVGDPAAGRSDVPASLVEATLRCLRPNVEDRFQTARELELSLREVLRDLRPAVDDSDLSRLVTSKFEKKRADFEDRLRRGEVASAEPGGEVAAAEEEGSRSTIGVELHTGSRRRRRGRLLMLAALSLIAVSAASFWFWQQRAAEPTAAVPSESAKSASTAAAAPAVAVSSPAMKASATSPDPVPSAPSAAPSNAAPDVRKAEPRVRPRPTAQPKPTPKPKDLMFEKL